MMLQHTVPAATYEVLRDTKLTHSVQLIDKDHRGRTLARLRKEVSYPGSPPPNKQLHKLAG